LLVERHTRLFELFGTRRVRINSLHNQSIDRLGTGLRISGRDVDGIVQAVEHPDRAFLLGVQWHPEFLLASREQRSLFTALVQAARRGASG
jgi:putative glutamine amidotransferase